MKISTLTPILYAHDTTENYIFEISTEKELLSRKFHIMILSYLTRKNFYWKFPDDDNLKLREKNINQKIFTRSIHRKISPVFFLQDFRRPKNTFHKSDLCIFSVYNAKVYVFFRRVSIIPAARDYPGFVAGTMAHFWYTFRVRVSMKFSYRRWNAKKVQSVQKLCIESSLYIYLYCCKSESSKILKENKLFYWLDKMNKFTVISRIWIVKKY